MVQLHPSASLTLMGIMGDSVAEVLNLVAGEMEDTPDFGGGRGDSLPVRHDQG